MATRPKKPAKIKETPTVLHLRVTPELKAQFTAAAEAARRNLSDWARLVLEDASAAHKAPK